MRSSLRAIFAIRAFSRGRDWSVAGIRERLALPDEYRRTAVLRHRRKRAQRLRNQRAFPDMRTIVSVRGRNAPFSTVSTL